MITARRRFQLECEAGGMEAAVRPDPDGLPTRLVRGKPRKGCCYHRRMPTGELWLWVQDVDGGECGSAPESCALWRRDGARWPATVVIAGLFDPTFGVPGERWLRGDVRHRWRIYTHDASFATIIGDRLCEAPYLRGARVVLTNEFIGVGVARMRTDIGDVAMQLDVMLSTRR